MWQGWMLKTEKEAQWHPTGTSKGSNKYDRIQSFWLRFYNGGQWDIVFKK